MRKLKQIGKIFSVLVTVVIAAMLICNVYLIVARTFFHEPSVFGYSGAVVVSGSMADVIRVNDMVIIHEEDHYEVNDIVMFRSDGILVTHRIIEKTEGGFITKGDANNVADGEIGEEKIVGKVVLIIPKIGAVIEQLQSPVGMMVMLLGLFVLIQWPYVAEKISEKSQG